MGLKKVCGIVAAVIFLLLALAIGTLILILLLYKEEEQQLENRSEVESRNGQLVSPDTWKLNQI